MIVFHDCVVVDKHESVTLWTPCKTSNLKQSVLKMVHGT